MPDMAALMPRWIATGLLAAFIQAGIFDNIRSAFNGSGIVKGLKFGLMFAVIYASFGMAYSGVFNLPDAIWAWWALDGLIVYLAGGLVLGAGYILGSFLGSNFIMQFLCIGVMGGAGIGLGSLVRADRDSSLGCFADGLSPRPG